MQKKLCEKCREYKELDKFSNYWSGEYGKTSVCKSCTKEYSKKYYIANRERLDKQTKKYNKEHPWIGAACRERRRIKKKENFIKLNKKDKKLHDDYYNMCSFLGTDKYQVDHIIPIAEGGTNHPSNLQILTVEDNLSKGAKLNYTYKHPRIVIE